MEDKASNNSLQLVIFNFKKNVAKICHLAIKKKKKSPKQHGQKNNTLKK
jgi:hypothetical protein